MDRELEQIRSALDEMIAQIVPDAVAREMYGGLMYELVPGDHSTRLFGHFAHKAHVSLEFTEGARFNDPAGRLEGKGKLRRHLKFTSMADLETKDPAYYMKQAL